MGKPVVAGTSGWPRLRWCLRRVVWTGAILAVLGGIECASRELRPEHNNYLTDSHVATEVDHLRALIHEHRRAAAKMTAVDRVRGWLALVTQFQGIAGNLEVGKANLVVDDVLAALPPASDWPTLESELQKSSATLDNLNPPWLILSALSNYLNGKADRFRRDSIHLSDAVGGFGWSSGWATNGLRDLACRVARTDDGGKSALEQELTFDGHRRRGRIKVPEIFDVLPASKAESVLRRALQLSYPVEVARGGKTESVARRLANELVEHLKVPQWSLTFALDQDGLYDKLAARFPTTLEQFRSGPGIIDQHERRTAMAYRLVRHLLRGELAQAESLAPFMWSEDRALERSLCAPAEELARQGDLVGLRKLEEFVMAHADKGCPLQSWSAYRQIATLAGRTDSISDVLERAQAGQAGWEASWLNDALVAHYLARGRADDALPPLRRELRLLGEMERKGEQSANQRLGHAAHLFEMGVILKRQELIVEGESEIAKCAVTATLSDVRCSEPDRDVGADLSAAGRTVEAIDRARRRVAADARCPVDPNSRPPRSQEALLSLVGVLYRAGAYLEIVRLIETEPGWLATDLADIITESAAGIPLGLAVARGLIETRRTDTARSILERLLRHRPECEGAFELLASVAGGSTAPLFEELIRDNPLATRPLIWRARLYLDGGEPTAAEPLLRRAIQLDPFDRGQEPPARMHAHRLLSALAPNDIELSKLVKAPEFEALGHRLLRAELSGQAIDLFKSALELVPTHSALRLKMAEALADSGRPDEALREYRRAFDDLLAHGCSGCCRSSGCSSPVALFSSLARHSLAEALAASSESTRGTAAAHYLKGLLAEREASPRAAVREYQAAVRADPDHWPSWLRLQSLEEDASRAGHADIGVDPDATAQALLRLDPGRLLHRPIGRELRNPAGVWPALERAAEIERRRSGPLLAIPKGRARTDMWANRERKWTSASEAFLSVAEVQRFVMLVIRGLREHQPGLAGKIVRAMGSR